MRQHRLPAAVLLAAAALLLAPAAGRAQMSAGATYYGGSPAFYGGPLGYLGPGSYPYGVGALSWPGAFSYTQRYEWYGYNWPYNGYYPHHYHTTPYFPRGGPLNPNDSIRTPRTERSSDYSYGALSGEGGTARVKVALPDADAQVWFEGQLTKQQGTQRGFVSPRLEPGREYMYDVTARWNENGRAVERTQTVRVRADGVVTVDFTTR